jgi:hypothetical protein
VAWLCRKDDLITHRAPPPNRVGLCDGGEEQHLSEGAVMVAFAMHLLRTIPELREVSFHPDGEHGKRFDFQGWLGKRGFTMSAPSGETSYGGIYVSPDGRCLVVNPSSGRGDMVAYGPDVNIVADRTARRRTSAICGQQRIEEWWERAYLKGDNRLLSGRIRHAPDERREEGAFD